MAYQVQNFLSNVQEHTLKAHEVQKRQMLGEIVGSLQKPFQDIMEVLKEVKGKEHQNLQKSLAIYEYLKNL